MSWWDRQAYKSTALASGTNQGLVSTGTQTFAGDKTFSDDVTVGGDINLSTATFTGAVDFNSTIDVLGLATFDTATFTDAVTCQTTLEVQGDSTFDTATFEDTVNFDAATTHDADIITTAQDALIRSDTTDTDDDKSISIASGGAGTTSRGGYIRLSGNEHATRPGEVELYAGNVTGGEVKIFTEATQRVRVPKDGGVIVVDDSSISTPSGGNLLYSNSGALISRDSSGAEWSLNPAWADWTPTYGAATGTWSPTTNLARYMQIGKMVFCVLEMTAGSVSDLTAYLTVSLPVTVVNTSSDHPPVTGWLDWDGGASRAVTLANVRDNTTTMRIFTPTLANIPAGDARFLASFFYEAA